MRPRPRTCRSSSGPRSSAPCSSSWPTSARTSPARCWTAASPSAGAPRAGRHPRPPRPTRPLRRHTHDLCIPLPARRPHRHPDRPRHRRARRLLERRHQLRLRFRRRGRGQRWDADHLLHRRGDELRSRHQPEPRHHHAGTDRPPAHRVEDLRRGPHRADPGSRDRRRHPLGRRGHLDLHPPGGAALRGRHPDHRRDRQVRPGALLRPRADGGLTYHKVLLEGGQDYSGPFSGEHLDPIETPDDLTLVFHLNRPYGDFGWIASTPAFAPVPEDSGEPETYATAPVTSGPYRLESYAPGSRAVLVRNENWDAATDEARTGGPDQIEFALAQDASVVAQSIIADRADSQTAFLASFVPTAQLV